MPEIKMSLSADQVLMQRISYLAYLKMLSNQLSISMEEAEVLKPQNTLPFHLTIWDALRAVNSIWDKKQKEVQASIRLMAPSELDYDQLSVAPLNEYAWQELVARLIGLPSATNAPEIRSEQYKEWTIETALKEGQRIFAIRLSEANAYAGKHPEKFVQKEPQSDVAIDFVKNYISKKAQLSILARWVGGSIDSDDECVYQSKLTPGTVHSVKTSETDLMKFLDRLKGIVHEKFHQEGADSVRKGLKKGIENFVNSL